MKLSPRRSATQKPDEKNGFEQARGSALQRALKLLSYRSRSRHELATRLRVKGFPSEVIEDVVAELEESGLLDDACLARDIVTNGQRASKSRSHIYADLRRRGIARDDAEESLQGYFDPVRELESAAQLIQKSLSVLPSSPARSDIEKAARRLFRRGFSVSAIANALDDIPSDEDSHGGSGFLDTDSQLS